MTPGEAMTVVLIVLGWCAAIGLSVTALVVLAGESVAWCARRRRARRARQRGGVIELDVWRARRAAERTRPG